jgi:hypothetical protein
MSIIEKLLVITRRLLVVSTPAPQFRIVGGAFPHTLDDATDDQPLSTSKPHATRPLRNCPANAGLAPARQGKLVLPGAFQPSLRSTVLANHFPSSA